MKRTLLICFLILFSTAVLADYDYPLGQIPSSGDSQNMWCDCSNGMIREIGGQTFVAPYTGNLTGVKLYVNMATGTSTMRMNIGPTDVDHHPLASTVVGSRTTNSLTPGWTTWTFNAPYHVTQGTEYAIYWDGNYQYVGTATVFVWMTSAPGYTNGGELFYENIWSNVWTGGSPEIRDFIMNITYAGTPCTPDWVCQRCEFDTCTDWLDNNNCGMEYSGDTSCRVTGAPLRVTSNVIAADIIEEPVVKELSWWEKIVAFVTDLFT